MEPFRLHELTLSGTPRERGRTHGETLRPEIQEAIAAHSDAVVRATGLEPGRLFERVVHGSGFLTAAERWTPDLVEEVRGIAEGSGRDFDTLFAWQLIQEMAWYPQKHVLSEAAVPLCTSLGSCPAEGSTIIAQTVDGTGWGRGRGMITHVTDPETGIRANVLGWPGLIGVYGMNDRGIGICCNSMFMDVSNSPTGLGALFAVRKVLAQSTFEDVDAFVRGVPHASGTNFMIGAPGHAVSYEVSAAAVEAYTPDGNAPVTYHTNHVLANPDRVTVEMEGWDTNSRTRFSAVQARMQAAPRHLAWEDARAIISSHDDPEHPICRHYQSDEAGMTLFGIVIECSPEPVLHVSSGPPCCTEFRTFDFPEPTPG
jgi:hypothetical protein